MKITNIVVRQGNYKDYGGDTNAFYCVKFKFNDFKFESQSINREDEAEKLADDLLQLKENLNKIQRLEEAIRIAHGEHCKCEICCAETVPNRISLEQRNAQILTGRR